MALEGREDAAKSVLAPDRDFMGQLDDNKDDIVDAIESLNRLAIAVRRAAGTHRRRPRRAAQRADSLDRQRDDLVKMLQALDRARRRRRPGDPASKDATIEPLQQLQPVLTQLGQRRRRLRQRLQRLPDLPVRRRGRRPRPAGRPQPAHGRLHEPVGPARHRPGDGGCPGGADQLPTLTCRRSSTRPDHSTSVTRACASGDLDQQGLPGGARRPPSASPTLAARPARSCAIDGQATSASAQPVARPAGLPLRQRRCGGLGRLPGARRCRRPRRRCSAPARPASTGRDGPQGPTMRRSSMAIYDPAPRRACSTRGW